MDSLQGEIVVGRYCKLLKPVRDKQGRNRFEERPKIIREVKNLDRRMFLVQFIDGSTTFLFPEEVTLN
ncbi:MAG TPA: hypothetical protein VGI47_12200 [Candidatus Binataceae bacterium]|jgi:hypothetical protein